MKHSLFGKKHSVARKLLVAVILMSTAMTIFTSAYQLYSNYQRYVEQIHVRFDEIKKVHLNNLTNRLWTADLEALRFNLEEISILPDIQYMEIQEHNQIVTTIGSRLYEDVITQTFPMTYTHRGKPTDIGLLTVQATLKNAYRQVLDQIFDILVSNAIKTFFLASFILFIFNYLITRHLEKMADYAEKLDINRLDQSLSLDRKRIRNKDPDELEVLVNAFYSMQRNLESSIKQLKDSESHYKQLVESTTAIPWELDLSTWLFTYVGPQAVTVLGYPVNDWYKKDFWTDHMHPEDKEFSVAYCVEATKEGRDHEFEYRMLTADGKTIWIRDDVRVICKNDEPVRLQGYMFDITDRKLAELELEEHRNNLEKLISERTIELVASNKELEAFAYSVSHDLRAPLRGIDGFSQILLEDNADKLDETSVEYLQRIRNSAQLMGQIINDLLLLSRVTRQELNIKSINLADIANQTIERLNESTSRIVDISIEDDLVTEADENLVPIIIENLIGNAWKYTSKKDEASIEFGKTSKKGKMYFYVKDNGIGFNMDYADKIFQPFQRLHTDKNFDGTGIGLATVYRAIQRQGGEVFAESSPDQGATFYFSFS